MKKLFLLPLMLLSLCCCSTTENENESQTKNRGEEITEVAEAEVEEVAEVEIIARYENVLFDISKETGELTVAHDYYEGKIVIIHGKEYKTMNYVYVRYYTTDDELSNVFFIRKNAPDLLIVYYH